MSLLEAHTRRDQIVISRLLGRVREDDGDPVVRRGIKRRDRLARLRKRRHEDELEAAGRAADVVDKQVVDVEPLFFPDAVDPDPQSKRYIADIVLRKQLGYQILEVRHAVADRHEPRLAHFTAAGDRIEAARGPDDLRDIGEVERLDFADRELAEDRRQLAAGVGVERRAERVRVRAGGHAGEIGRRLPVEEHDPGGVRVVPHLVDDRRPERDIAPADELDLIRARDRVREIKAVGERDYRARECLRVVAHAVEVDHRLDGVAAVDAEGEPAAVHCVGARRLRGLPGVLSPADINRRRAVLVDRPDKEKRRSRLDARQVAQAGPAGEHRPDVRPVRRLEGDDLRDERGDDVDRRVERHEGKAVGDLVGVSLDHSEHLAAPSDDVLRAAVHRIQERAEPKDLEVLRVRSAPQHL